MAFQTCSSACRKINGKPKRGRTLMPKRNNKKVTTSQLLEVARLCHRDGLNQMKIANRLGVTPVTIGRWLREAESLGIIQVRIVAPPLVEMRADLIERFHLKDAVV